MAKSPSEDIAAALAAFLGGDVPHASALWRAALERHNALLMT